MSDDISSEKPNSDDARRAALLAEVNATSTPEHPTNPYALALGWISGILLAIGVIVMLAAASQANDQPDGVVNLAVLLTGVVFTGFGLTALMLLLAAQLVRWTPPADGEHTPQR